MNCRRKLLVIFLFFQALWLLYPETAIEIKKGDTLFSIAKKYQIPLTVLIRINNVKDTSKVSIGTKITIPGTYTVKSGDSLYAIAKEYNLTIEDICFFNDIEDVKTIKKDQILYLPGEKTVSTVSTTPVTTITADAGTLLWPHTGKREKIDSFITGVTITGLPGDPIIAVTTGKVIWAGYYRGYKNTIFIKTKDEYIFVYAGGEKLLVKAGDIVETKQQLAALAKNNSDDQGKVYFFIFKDGNPVNPEFRL